MPTILSLNGQHYPADTPLFTAANRAFRYGDAVFESIAMFNKKIPLFAGHYERLINACNSLYFDLPEHFTVHSLHDDIIHLSAINNATNARIRLTVYRSEGGLYAPDNNIANVLIEMNATDVTNFNYYAQNGLQIGICNKYRLSLNDISELKTANALPYVLAARYAQQQGWHDAILLNQDGELVETTAANIWLLQGDTAFTPPLSSGCVGGVMRQYLLKYLPTIGIYVDEKPLLLDDIQQAEAVWLTNATQGIRWVERCEGRLFGRIVPEIM